jgi:hypothetical protein
MLMRRSSDRGQAEPLAALAAVFAVSVGLALYAGGLDDAIPGQPESETPEAVLESVHRSLDVAGVTSPSRLENAVAAVPDGWHANVTLSTAGEQYQRGPTPPVSAEHETRRVSVKTAPKHVDPGQLRVVVWR